MLYIRPYAINWSILRGRHGDSKHRYYHICSLSALTGRKFDGNRSALISFPHTAHRYLVTRTRAQNLHRKNKQGQFRQCWFVLVLSPETEGEEDSQITSFSKHDKQIHRHMHHNHNILVSIKQKTRNQVLSQRETFFFLWVNTSGLWIPHPHSPAGSTGLMWAGGGRLSVAPLLPRGRNATQSDQSLPSVGSTLQMLRCLTHPARSAEWGHQSLQSIEVVLLRWCYLYSFWPGWVLFDILNAYLLPDSWFNAKTLL